MNAVYTRTHLHPAHTARAQRGFTLVELMVTVAIAMFLLFGLTTIVQNIREANINQTAMSQLQDEERFALTVITDVVQNGGYFPDPTLWMPTTSLTQDAPSPSGNWEAGQDFNGTSGAPAPGAGDTLSVRYRTNLNDGVTLCDGSTNTANGPSFAYINTFTVVQAAPPAIGGLYCQVNNGGASAAAPGVMIVPNVVSMKIYYGVKRDTAFADYNVDTYLTAANMCSTVFAPCGTDDWNNISSVRVVLWFANPLAGQPGQAATIVFERVIEVMGRGGVHT
jgi:type IV pilus assembly protein PilW